MILGCTLSIIIPIINDYFGGEKVVISSGLETAREVSALLTFSNEHAGYKRQPEHKLLQETEHIELIIEEWLKMKVKVEKIEIQNRRRNDGRYRNCIK